MEVQKKVDYDEYQKFMQQEGCPDKEFDQGKDCPVCYNIMVEPIKLPNCNHRFCIACLNAAYRKQGAGEDKKCPLCRGVNKHQGFYTADDLDREKQMELREKHSDEFLERQAKLREAGLLVCEVEVVGLQVGNSFNSRKDEWIAQIKLQDSCKEKYVIEKLIAGASFHFCSFDEKKKAWRLSFNKKQERYQFDPDTVDEEYEEFDQESSIFIKAVLGEGVRSKEDRLLKHRQALCFDKGGFWK